MAIRRLWPVVAAVSAVTAAASGVGNVDCGIGGGGGGGISLVLASQRSPPPFLDMPVDKVC